MIVFDLHLRQVKWVQHLDLSTDLTSFRAYIYSAPVLADLDNDGKLEIIVGTSMVRTALQTPDAALQNYMRELGLISQKQVALSRFPADGIAV